MKDLRRELVNVTVIVRVSCRYRYTRRSVRVQLDIFYACRVRVRVTLSATGTGRVAEIDDMRGLGDSNSVCPSVRLSVCPSLRHACFVTKLQNILLIF